MRIQSPSKADRQMAQSPVLQNQAMRQNCIEWHARDIISGCPSENHARKKMSTCHTAQATKASKGEQAQHNALSCIHIEFITHPELWFLICAVQELCVAQLVGKLERMRELRLAFRVEVGTSTGLVLCIQAIHDVPGS